MVAALAWKRRALAVALAAVTVLAPIAHGKATPGKACSGAQQGQGSCKARAPAGLALVQRQATLEPGRAQDGGAPFRWQDRGVPATSEALSQEGEADNAACCSPLGDWPSVDNGVTCGECRALVLTGPFGGRCDRYCQSFGHVCVAAAEELDEGCGVKREYSCDEEIRDTSDMLCTCRMPQAAQSCAVPAPTPAPVGASVDVPIKLMTFNVYFASLGTPRRVDGISTAISQMDADIGVITEQWGEKPAILKQVREKSGRNYTFCDSGRQEKTWDGDILYDQDQWEALEDGVKDLGSNRGLSWAVMRHRASQRGLLVYGVHPLCCGNERAHLQNAVDFAAHAQSRPEYPEMPVVIMGDFNALEDWGSTKLYKGERVWAYNRHWQLPFAFDDVFRVPRGNRYVDGTTHDSGSRLDYIFAERRSPRVFHVSSARIWRSAPGSSDHYPIVADVVLRR